METQLETRNVMFAFQTTDARAIDAITLECFDAIKTDQACYITPAERLVCSPLVRFVEINSNNETCGILALAGNEIHTLFRKALRGRAAINAMRCGLGWVWANTPFSELVSHAYSNRPDAIRFAKMAGFIQVGVSDDGTTVGGVPVQRTDFIYPKP